MAQRCGSPVPEVARAGGSQDLKSLLIEPHPYFHKVLIEPPVAQRATRKNSEVKAQMQRDREQMTEIGVDGAILAFGVLLCENVEYYALVIPLRSVPAPIRDEAHTEWYTRRYTKTVNGEIESDREVMQDLTRLFGDQYSG